jgi:hypothetical protein
MPASCGQAKKSRARQGTGFVSWQSDEGQHMVRHVKRSLFRTLIYVLVGGQVLLSAPVIASASLTTASASEMPCADMMPQQGDSTPCPCCPDGVTSVAACLSACTASVAVISTLMLPQVVTAAAPEPAFLSAPLPLSADPPLDPPPID